MIDPDVSLTVRQRIETSDVLLRHWRANEPLQNEEDRARAKEAARFEITELIALPQEQDGDATAVADMVQKWGAWIGRALQG